MRVVAPNALHSRYHEGDGEATGPRLAERSAAPSTEHVGSLMPSPVLNELDCVSTIYDIEMLGTKARRRDANGFSEWEYALGWRSRPSIGRPSGLEVTGTHNNQGFPVGTQTVH